MTKPYIEITANILSTMAGGSNGRSSDPKTNQETSRKFSECLFLFLKNSVICGLSYALYLPMLYCSLDSSPFNPRLVY